MQSKNFAKKIIRFVTVFAFWILVWKAASLLAGERLALFLPGPERVLCKWWEMLFQADFLRAVGYSLLRIFEGFVLGAVVGAALGVVTAYCKPVHALLSPLMRMIRAVPVVSFIILVFVFLQVDRIPVFICFLMVMPLVWQSMQDGLTETDGKLLEMSRVYGLGQWKTLWFVRLPAALPGLITTCVSALGLAWKSGVAAEVISAPDFSLGYEITTAKSDLAYDELFAVTLTVVLLSLIFEVLFKFLCAKLLGKGATK